MLKPALVALVLTLSAALSPAQVVRVDRDAIDALFDEWDRSDAPGCALGVILDGELVYARGYGLANLEHGIANSPSSVFRIASTSKQVTATCLGLLVLDGKLSLDDDVRAHLPELPDYGEPITLRHLVHHTSGLRDYLTLMSLSGRREQDWYSTEEALEVIFRQEATNFAPGADHLYSNTGYLLMGEIVRRVSGHTLREFASERVFKPLRMRHTQFVDDHTAVVPQLATGYAQDGAGGFRVDMTTLDMVGDGGVHTSVEDWLLWDRNAYEHTLGGEALHALLRERAVLDDGRVLDYAFGLGLSRYRGLAVEGHGGAFVGYRADSWRFPEQNFSVICFANLASFDPTERCREVADLCLAELFSEPAPPERDRRRGSRGAEGPQALELSAEQRAAWVGEFRSHELLDVVYRLREEGDELRLVLGGEELALTCTAAETLEGAGLVLRRLPSGDFLLDAGRVRGVRFARLPSSTERPEPAAGR